MKGAVAAGHPLTVRAATDVLHAGGNAFDAALAGMAMAFVAEPVLASPGGGGFMVARPAGGVPRAYDFFARTPKVKRPADEIDFHATHADFGPTRQEFHIGMGSTATPGAIAGFFRILDDLGSMSADALLQPAVATARTGFEINRFQAQVMSVVAPIYQATEAARRLYAGSDPETGLFAAGDRLHNPDIADLLERLGREGADLFYRGDIAQDVTALSAASGGHLTMEDMTGYQVQTGSPIDVTYRGWRVAANPAPSSGGVLVALGLALLDSLPPESAHSPGRLRSLAAVMAETDRLRLSGDISAERLLAPEIIGPAKSALRDSLLSTRGTSHISVVDAAGNVAALTLSNGEGNGHLVPGCGFMLNNVLGEEDINPGGFHNWRPDSPMASMMTPCILQGPDGQLVALGSGGSNRIRTAILQLIRNIAGCGMDLASAVVAPRLHVEAGRADIEPGFPTAELALLRETGLAVHEWPEPSMFFGGTQVAGLTGRGFEAAGDPRRDGDACLS